MNKFNTLTSLWQNVREADLRPMREQALHGIHIAIVGAPGSGRSTLADQIRRDPNRPQLVSDAPVLVLDLSSAEQGRPADLIILMIDSRQSDTSREQELIRSWQNNARRVLVFINQFESETSSQAVSPWTSQGSRRVVVGSLLDARFLVDKFAPAIIEIVPELLLALGRYFPLFRLPIAHHLINETSFSNAAYAMSTGLVETFGILDIPITITDTVILTKAQAFLVYKLGLALGYSTRWQDYIGEFGSVLGGGFVWRQLARSLIGLIPIWGIIPKTAVAYAGTYVVGNAVLQWYLTGKHVSKKQMQQLYSQALEQGKSLARRLPISRLRLPRLSLRLPRLLKPGQERPLLPSGERRKRKGARYGRLCPKCAKTSAGDASFCQYCGAPFETQ